MAEELFIATGSKSERYQHLLKQLEFLIQPTNSLIANMANMAAAIHHTFNWLWTGFYLEEKGQLMLGPFQGPIACTTIAKGKGVCGTAWATEQTIIVPNVLEFPGHIACSSLSLSEIVVPIFNSNNFIGVLDIDSKELNSFDDVDKGYLEKIVTLLFK